MENIILNPSLPDGMSGPFDDILSANAAYTSSFEHEGVRGVAGKTLLVLTCMDSRIVPHQVLGLDVGDVKVVRNAGGQLNPEVEKDLVLASHLLEVDRVLIMPHTRCAMASASLADVQSVVAEQSGADASGFEPRLIGDASSKLAEDVAALAANPLLRPGTVVQGAFYDVDSGAVRFV